MDRLLRSQQNTMSGVGQATMSAVDVRCPAYSFAMRRSRACQLHVSGAPLHVLKHGRCTCGQLSISLSKDDDDWT